VVSADPAWIARDVHRSVFQDRAGAWDAALARPDALGTPLAVLPVKPASFPSLSVKTLHWMCYGWPRSNHAASITLVSPISGEITTLTLWLTTTTLRGARRMRGLDGADAP
jgi:hypothetical protein